MKKRLFAVLLAAVLGLSQVLPVLAAPAAAPAADEAEAARTLAVLNVMVGDGSGDLHLDARVTRAEFTKMAVACSPYADSVGAAARVKPYPDVPRESWYAPYVELARDKELVKGDVSTGRFWPEGNMVLEEAVTLALRLLGYQDSSFSGRWPAGQMAMYRTLKLDRGVTAQQGEAITRRDAMYLFYNLLTCKTAQGQVYAATLGYAVTDGKVDYMAQAKKDLEGPFLAGDGAPDLGFTPRAVYFNGRAADGISWEKDDVWYCNRALGMLWVYRDSVFGTVGALAPTAAEPTSVTVDGRSYPLATDGVKRKLSALGDDPAGSLVTLLLGMDGEAVAAHTVNGPFVAGEAETALPFAPEQTYRDGKPSPAAVPGLYDVYYYDEDAAAVWIYTDRVSGKIDALAPNVLAPTAVTVDGVSYSFQNAALKRRLSALNGKWVGQYVTLLFGMDGGVVEVLTGETVAADYYGVAQSVQKTAEEGEVRSSVTVCCTDGKVRTFQAPGDAEYEAGDLVHIAITAQGAALERAKSAGLTGKVDKAAAQVGSLAFADDLEVLDTFGSAAAAVEPARLAGLTLSWDNVRFYTQNAAGEVDRLILKDVTDVLWDFGYLTSAVEQPAGGLSFTMRYTCLMDGQTKTVTAGNRSWPLEEKSGVAFRLGAGGAVEDAKSMDSAAVTSLTASAAYAGNRAFPLAEGVQVWLEEDGTYYAVEPEDVNAGNYDLTGWYDSRYHEIRVILAEKK